MKIEKLYLELMKDLTSSGIEYYLEQDKNVIKKIIETFTYIRNEKSLPPENILFRCEKNKTSVKKWLDSISKQKEKLYVDFIAYIKRYIYFTKTLELWEKKYNAFCAYIKTNKKLPPYGIKFFDGTDMHKWYNTQSDRLNRKRENCIPLNAYQKEKMRELIKWMQELKVESMYYSSKLTTKEKLKELYNLIVKEGKSLQNETITFSDKSSIKNFYSDIQNGKIKLNSKEQLFFNRLFFLMIRIKNNEVIGFKKYSNKRREKQVNGSRRAPNVINYSVKKKIPLEKKIVLKQPSFGSYLAYYRTQINEFQSGMMEHLSIERSNYSNLENNKYPVSFFRRIQLKILLEQMESKDEILLKMAEELAKSLEAGKQNQPYYYYLNELCAYFILNKEILNEETLRFAKKHYSKSSNYPQRKMSEKQKKLLFEELDQLERSIILPDKEQKTLTRLKTLIQ